MAYNFFNKCLLIINLLVLVYFGYREFKRWGKTEKHTTNPTNVQNDVGSGKGGWEKKRPVVGFLSYRPDQRRRLEALVQRKVGVCFGRRIKNEFIEINKN